LFSFQSRYFPQPFCSSFSPFIFCSRFVLRSLSLFYAAILFWWSSYIWLTFLMTLNRKTHKHDTKTSACFVSLCFLVLLFISIFLTIFLGYIFVLKHSSVYDYFQVQSVPSTTQKKTGFLGFICDFSTFYPWHTHNRGYRFWFF
jgi:hypothetical protein